MKQQLIGLTQNLRNRVEEYKKTNQFTDYILNRQDIRCIEIMINLTELALENDLKIKECDYHWFQGSYIIDYNFNGEWEDISDLYSQIIDILEKEKMIVI
ncbi:MAG: hypothetical protein M9897_05690 [Brumimicrobium sp.]|nr:hypothetical protein [Brumimicrobium sp.]